GLLEDIYRTEKPEVFAERILDSLEKGFTAVKCMPVPVAELIESPAALHNSARCVEAMRNAVGDKVDIMLDLHARTTTAAAIQFGRMLVDYNLYWYEEPCWPEHVDALVEVSRALPFPIATGERLVGRWEFRELLEKRACSIIQPDVSHCGGISEARRIAAMAETYSIPVACHNPQGPVRTASSIHIGVATPNYLIQEVVRADVPWRNDILTAPLNVTRGYVPPPTAPGTWHRYRRKGSGQVPLPTRGPDGLLPSRRLRRRLVVSAIGTPATLAKKFTSDDSLPVYKEIKQPPP
ncbi:MAG: mandelate racemase/muconate lactonizing enzyme family protein, partial [Bryobacterales bacterium]|nr:mandelate racemase/muconate lactonizing enzyme family protein [Bryobacterales bacterium]